MPQKIGDESYGPNGKFIAQRREETDPFSG